MKRYNKCTMQEVIAILEFSDIVMDSKGNATYNIPCAFDIETTSFMEGVQKLALCYLWQMDINGYTFYGRELEEFSEFIIQLNDYLMSREVNIIIYVHNLAFEFQFIRKYFDWQDVFARKTYKPMKATTGYITFKCSYFLTNYALKTVAQNLTAHKIEKLPDFDYTVLRTPKTPLTPRELEYAENDVLIVQYLIEEEIERNNGSILEIPLTQTSYARKMCRDACYDYKRYAGSSVHLSRWIHNMTVRDQQHYEQLKRAYSGGYTHANYLYADSTHPIRNVHSRDLASSYPSIMAMEMFPASSGENLGDMPMNKAQEYFKTHCCIFDVVFTNLNANGDVFENYLSKSKNLYKRPKGVKNNDIDANGRVIHADIYMCSLTEVDWSVVELFYTWGTVEFHNFTIYDRYYLPKPIVMTVLELYGQKTSLKGIESAKAQYKRAKELVNALYGMCVTDIVPDDILYNLEWDKRKPDVWKKLSKYNTQRNRFLYYPWGVYVTAYARRNLFMAIYSLGEDYIYTDTDSVKYLHDEKHQQFFQQYARLIDTKVEKICKYYDIPVKLYRPKDKYGNIHPIGYFEYEGKYDKFKTLGAKRYLVQIGEEYTLTAAGVDKEKTRDYLLMKDDNGNYLHGAPDPFAAFTRGLIVPGKYSGKLQATYVDECHCGTLTGIDGAPYDYNIRSCIHMKTSDYHFNITEEFFSLIHENALDIDMVSVV